MRAAVSTGMPSVRTGGVIGLVALAAVPLVVPYWAQLLLTSALAFSLPVLGVAILHRAGLVSFGHGMFYAAGAYSAGLAFRWWDLREATLVLLLALAASGALSMITGLIITRYRAIFFAMLILGFSMVLYSVLIKFFRITGGSDGIGVRPPSYFFWTPPAASARTVLYYTTLIVVSAMFAFVVRFFKSPVGQLLEAIRDNEVRVEYLGSSVRRILFIAFVFSGMLAGLGGALTGMSAGHVVPEFAFWTKSGDFVFVALLGGTGGAVGSLLGTIVFIFARNYAFKYAANYWQLILGLFMIFVIMVMPGGIWGLYENLKLRLRRDS